MKRLDRVMLSEKALSGFTKGNRLREVDWKKRVGTVHRVTTRGCVLVIWDGLKSASDPLPKSCFVVISSA